MSTESPSTENSPFFLEYEVDDEISFVQPKKVPALLPKQILSAEKANVNENSHPNICASVQSFYKGTPSPVTALKQRNATPQVVSSNKKETDFEGRDCFAKDLLNDNDGINLLSESPVQPQQDQQEEQQQQHQQQQQQGVESDIRLDSAREDSHEMQLSSKTNAMITGITIEGNDDSFDLLSSPQVPVDCTVHRVEDTSSPSIPVGAVNEPKNAISANDAIMNESKEADVTEPSPCLEVVALGSNDVEKLKLDTSPEKEAESAVDRQAMDALVEANDNQNMEDEESRSVETSDHVEPLSLGTSPVKEPVVTDEAGHQIEVSPAEATEALEKPINVTNPQISITPEHIVSEESAVPEQSNVMEVENVIETSAQSTCVITEGIPRTECFTDTEPTSTEEKADQHVTIDVARQSPAKTVVEASVKTRKPGRVASLLSSDYEGNALDQHMPKYSESEMQMIIEEKCAGISGSLVKCEEELAVLRTAVRDSAEEMASLRQANKDLVSEKEELLSRGDESNLLKTQVKALTHQVHMLEKKLTEGSEGFEREKEATKKRHANEITELSSAHEIALLELRRAMLSAESAKSEEVSAKHQTQLRELTKKAGDLENQLDGAEKRTAEAVADAKAKVYAKVKLQFDNGNKEFQKVKAALKEAQAEAAKHVSAVDEAQQNMALADAKAKESDEKKVAMVEQIGVINGKINEVVQGLHKAVCLIDSNESVGEMPSLSISLTENADADASTVAAPTVSALETAVIIIAKMKTKINKVQSDLQNASQGKDSLQSAMSVLEGSLRRAESSLSIATLRSLELETRAKTAEEQLESATKELEDTVTDRDAQMTAVAQMVSSVAAHDDVVGRYKDEIKELTERCTSLRSMNEELLAMMEKA